MGPVEGNRGLAGERAFSMGAGKMARRARMEVLNEIETDLPSGVGGKVRRR